MEAMLLDPAFRWQSLTVGDCRLHIASGPSPAAPLIECLHRNAVGFEQLLDCVRTMRPGFAAVVEGPDFVFGCADKIRSFPLFYTAASPFRLSNSARALLEPDAAVDDLAVLQFRMSGYVTAGRTVHPNVRQLQAGEAVFWKRGQPAPELDRYFTYLPTAQAEGNQSELIDELAQATDAIFTRLARNAADRPVWIPLSGGLDSRLILCKLHEHGCRSIQTFSYGPNENREADIARNVARRFDVPWFHFTVSPRAVRTYFESAQRTSYWRAADGLSVLPSMAEAVVFDHLVGDGRIPRDALIINGQSGDFISGNHIPPNLMQPDATEADLYATIIDRHFGLWHDLRTDANRERLEAKIRQELAHVMPAQPTRYQLVALFEMWEWQERQCKYVVNGQRLYDFLGLDWELPLWDEEYLWFWQRVPPGLRVGQTLYKNYLQAYNPKGVFTDQLTTKRPTAMPGWRSVPTHGVARVLQAVGMRAAAADVRTYAKYFGYYRHQYGAYAFRHFVRNARVHRNSVSYFAETWIEENLGLRLRP